MYVRVHPDIPKIENAYVYEVTPETKLSENITLGSCVRVVVHGRRVKGWVVEVLDSLPTDVTTEIKSVLEYVHVGIAPHFVAVGQELSRYYLCSPVVFYRAASPERKVSPREVTYMHVVRQLMPSTQQCIYVDPRADRREFISEHIADTGTTIIITPQSYQRFASWLNEKSKNVTQYSTPLEKNDFISAARRNNIIIGGRAALFAPTTDCSSIIVLDDSYEQLREERTPRYHIIDCAKIVADYLGIPLTVITSVPSPVTGSFQVDDRRTHDQWPRITILDRTQSDPALGAYTREITSTIHESHKLNTDSAIVVSSLASARMLVCASCDAIATCEVCDHSVIEDRDRDIPFVCPVCAASRVKVCLLCRGTTFKKYRKGLQSISEEVVSLFPAMNVVEVSAQTPDSSEHSQSTLYVGTEALLHRPLIMSKISSIIFLDFDTDLFRPTMSAFNRSIVLINRGLRLLRKTEHSSPVVIATRSAQHKVIGDIAEQNFVAQLGYELELRKTLGFAPFYATAEITTDQQGSQRLLSSVPHQIVAGTRQDKGKYLIMLRAPNHEELSSKAYKAVRKVAAQSRCTISVDQYD